jgi:quercetin dioxygenase-like cupin family protein
MKFKFDVRLLLIVCLSAALGTPAGAQQAPPGITVRTLVAGTTTITGKPLEFPLFRNQVFATLVEIAPGGRTASLRIQVPTVGYLLGGTVSVEIQGQPPRTLAADQALIAPVNTPVVVSNRGSGAARFLSVSFGDARRPNVVPIPGGPGPVGVRTTVVLQTTKTWNGEEIVFPTIANQFLVLVAEFAPGALNPLHVHPHTQFAYILEGDAAVEPVGASARTFRPGEAFVETLLPHVGANRATTVGKIFTIFVGEAGTPPTLAR